WARSGRDGGDLPGHGDGRDLCHVLPRPAPGPGTDHGVGGRGHHRDRPATCARRRDVSDARVRSRERILKATAAVAAERGYDGTTISEITRRSGLSASSVYWHFTDK